MKRLLASAAVILLCAPAFSQASDDPGPGAGLSFSSRIEANPSTEGFWLGNSSHYTLYKGNISPLISYSVNNLRLFKESGSFSSDYSKSGDINQCFSGSIGLSYTFSF